MSSHLVRLENAGYIKIEKTFKGKYPLTICRLTSHGKSALESYAQKMSVVSATVE